MIHVDRPPEPAFFRSKALTRERMRLHKFFKTKSPQAQTRFEFFLPGKEPKIAKSLFKTFAGKCAYCEQPIVNLGFYNVDSFRPKMEALNLDGKSSPHHYWWLAYQWNNLYLTCAVCNRLKGARFPVTGSRAPIGGDLKFEKALLLDPCTDRPEQLLLFDEQGIVASGDRRGRTTIEVLGLNRRELVAARRKNILALRNEWDRAIRSLRRKSPSVLPIRSFLDAARPFAAMTRQFAQQWGRELRKESPAFAEYVQAIDSLITALPPETASDPTSKAAVARVVDRFNEAKSKQTAFSVEDERRKRDYYLSSQLIERIEIRNFRVIKDVQFNVPLNTQDRGSWLLLLLFSARASNQVGR